MAICPTLLAGAQISTLVQERSPAGRHQVDRGPRQLAASPAGALEQGAANQVRLLGESAPAFGGHGDSEQGGDPNWQGAEQRVPPPTAHVPEENPAWLTNSSVTSRASKVAPLRQIPPPLVKSVPLQPLKE